MLDITLFSQVLYLGILILIGALMLSLRRKAYGTRTGYKLLLLLMGLLLGMLFSDIKIALFEPQFLKTIIMFILITLLFELSIRLNHENVILDYRNVGMLITMLVVNVLGIGLLSSYLLRINPLHGAVLGIILSSIEYFLVFELKGEGDLANPLILLFSFTILVFSGLQERMFENVVYFLKYLFIGLAMGVFVGIITFRILRYRQTSLSNEIGMIAVAILTYIVTEQMFGSGLFAIMILGIFFGNSYVRKTSGMDSFSPKIFKTLEMIIYLLIGFVVSITFDNNLWFKGLTIFLIYILLRLFIIHLYYSKYSIQNKLLLTFAPKGMILGIMILVFSVFSTFEKSALTVMLFILIYSLISGVIVEFYEQEKSTKIDKIIGKMIKKR